MFKDDVAHPSSVTKVVRHNYDHSISKCYFDCKWDEQLLIFKEDSTQILQYFSYKCEDFRNT